MHSLYSRHPNGPFRTLTGTRRARPRSVFNVRLFNGNLESFIKVLMTSPPACSSSYLLSVLRWLSGSFLVGSPGALKLWLIFYQQTTTQLLHCGNLPRESASSGSPGLRYEGGSNGFGGLQEERNGSWRETLLSRSAPLTHCWPGSTELLWQRYSGLPLRSARPENTAG